MVLPTTEGDDMDTLTRRGKIVFGAFLVLLSAATVWMIFDIATPSECKVPAAEMSEACLVLIYEK